MYKSKKKSSIVSSITIALILVIALLSGVIATAEGPLYDVQFELTSEVDNSGAKLQQVFLLHTQLHHDQSLLIL